MKPQDFLDVADELAGGPHEGHWRSAVSRAYYSAFHAARALLRRCGFHVPRDDKAHAYLRMRLTNGGHPDVEQAGIWLDDLRTVRNQADYAIDAPFDHTDAVDRVQRAADVVRLLDEAAALSSVRDQITQAMRDYERDVLHEVTWRP
jgi:uncharacterized protein (UPF0332 family)